MATSVTVDSITFTFDAEERVGQFAGGDWWVQGPVTITSITPNASGGNNGWQVNPNLIDNKANYGDTTCIGGSCGSQSLDSEAFRYDAGQMPALPYTASGGESIVKGVAEAGDTDCGFGSCLQEAAVLTVLSSVPPNDGATVFRPPYMGTDKPLYSTSSFDTQYATIPSLSSTSAIDDELPTMASALDKIKRPNISSHVQEWSMFQAILNVGEADALEPNPYAPEIAAVYITSVLRAFVNKAGDSAATRRQIMLAAVQRGIDVIGSREMGMNWYAAGGVNHGYMLPAVLAAYMLDDQDMKDLIAATPQTAFQETGEVWPHQHGGPVLYGHDRGETAYWTDVVAAQDNGTNRDPYGYIDGGSIPGGRYQACCSLNDTKGYAAIVHLLGAESVWDDANTLAIADRWESSGLHTQPDPCAPVSQGGGADPSGPNCILDPDLTPGSTFESFSCEAGEECGRFPALHGTKPDGKNEGGQRVGFRSLLADVIWDEYQDLWGEWTIPTIASTGVTDEGALVTVNSNVTLNTNDQVYEDRLVNGCITVEASGVTIRNVRVNCTGIRAIMFDDQFGYNDASPLLIEDTEMDCNLVAGSHGFTEGNATLRRVEIRECENGLSLNQGVLMEDSYIHDLAATGGDPHEDGVQFGCGHYTGNGSDVAICDGENYSSYDDGAADIHFRRNYIAGITTTDANGTSAIIMNADVGDTDILIENNLLDGGGTTVYCNRAPNNGTNVRIINNRFTDTGNFISDDCANETDVSGNVDHATGDPLTLD